jgi:hypothetical protein
LLHIWVLFYKIVLCIHQSFACTPTKLTLKFGKKRVWNIHQWLLRTQPKPILLLSAKKLESMLHLIIK